MKIYEQRVSKGLNVSTAALLSVLVYLIIAVILSFIQSYIDPTGESYNTTFGIVQFLIASLYWILIDFLLFSRKGRTGRGAIVTYLIFTMLPIVVFTIATSVLVIFYPTTDFTTSWNLLTWIIAPTLFWYTPFSYVFFAFGYYITIPTFMMIILIYLICIQCVGIILGLARRASLTEKEEAKKQAQERAQLDSMRPQVTFESVSDLESIEEDNGLIAGQESEGLYTGTNPFREREESIIIDTDSINIVTDDIIREYNSQSQPLHNTMNVEINPPSDEYLEEFYKSPDLDSILTDDQLNNFSIDDLPGEIETSEKTKVESIFEKEKVAPKKRKKPRSQMLFNPNSNDSDE